MGVGPRLRRQRARNEGSPRRKVAQQGSPWEEAGDERGGAAAARVYEDASVGIFLDEEAGEREAAA